MFLRQSTSQLIRFGPFLDATDAVTAETALTIAQADMQLSLDGAAFAQKNAAGNATHDTDGWYSTTLNATDTATVGELYMQVVVAGALPVWVRYYVVEESVYDALFAAGGSIEDAADVADAVLDELLSGHTTAGSLGQAITELLEGIIFGTAQTGTLSTTQCSSSLTGFLDDELIDATIVFTSGVANGQRSTITDYAATNGLITFNAITTAPANLDRFKIV